MKKLLMILLPLMVATVSLGCNPDNRKPQEEIPGGNDDEGKDDPGQPEDPDSANILITVGQTTFYATLADNETATEFKKLLPMTVSMTELNGNEKYCALSVSLPTDASNPGTIRNGDIMLYGPRTLVLFYESFQTSYSYTRVGTVDNPSGLENALGTGNVTVTFALLTE